LTETITNTGNSAVQISAITVSGTGYSLSGAGAVTLNPSQTFTFSVIFGPSAAGAANGSITVTSNATGSPAAISLTGTGAVATTHTVGLTWNDTGSSIAGFNVYRSTTSGGGYVKVNGALVPSTNYTDASVQNSTTYYYVTTAVDSSGNESAYSNEAPAIVPN
jgi:predicted phage tail protein